MNKLLGHLRTVLIHKHYVFLAAAKMGQPWRGFMHDWSKFSPVEFLEGVRYYNGRVSPINQAIAEHGYSKAWQHHKGRNPHHFEYWYNHAYYDNAPIEVPYQYAVEMIADRIGAARAYKGADFKYDMPYQYHIGSADAQKYMHPKTYTFITLVLKYVMVYDEIPKPNIVKLLYSQVDLALTHGIDRIKFE